MRPATARQMRLGRAVRQCFEGQNTLGPISASSAGIRVSAASSMSATEVTKAGAIVWNDLRSERPSAPMAAITTKADDAMATPTRCTAVRTATRDSSPARRRSR